MTLSNTLSQVFTRKRATAKEHYFALLRDGKDAEEIASAAEVAGVSEAEVQEQAKILEQVAALTVEANKFPAATAARLRDVAAFEKAQRELQEAIDRLQPLVAQAFNIAHQSEAFEASTRSKAEQLRGLYSSYPEMLPMATAPAVIQSMVAEIKQREDSERARLEKQIRFSKARERCDQAEYQLAHAGDRRTFMGRPTSLAGPSRAEADERREIAQAELAAAEAELDEAAKAMEQDGR